MARRKKMRKAYLQRFAADNIHTGPKKANYVWLQNSQENAEQLRRGELMFFDANGKHVGDGWISGPNPRKVVQENLEVQRVLQSTRFQRVEEFNHIALIKTKKQELRLYFSGGDHFLMEINHVVNSVKRSIIFKDKKKLLRAYDMGVITWVESSPLVR